MKKYIITEEQLSIIISGAYLSPPVLKEYKENPVERGARLYQERSSKKSLHERETIAAEKTAEAVVKMVGKLKQSMLIPIEITTNGNWSLEHKKTLLERVKAFLGL